MEQSLHGPADPDPADPPISRDAATVNRHADSPFQVPKMPNVIYSA
ncbi:MAG: hypothetical protein H6Q51_2118 [Deltaproteobacteria bacterium]|nr:hypothetical protein [Deltaproteobacteria bacterium]